MTNPKSIKKNLRDAPTITTQLQLKSSTTTNAPATLGVAEPAVSTVAGVTRFFVGAADASTAVNEIALLASPAFTGSPTAPTQATGDNSTNIATTGFVQDAVTSFANGFQDKAAVTVATTAALPAYTAVGATLTATANGILSIDGNNTWIDVANDSGSPDPTSSNSASRAVLKNETGGINNGIYYIQDKGSVSTPWIITRSPDALTGTELVQGTRVLVLEGVANNSTQWVVTTPDPIVIGTSNIVWAQVSLAPNILAGDGLTKSDSTLSVVPDTTTGGAYIPVKVVPNGVSTQVDSTMNQGVGILGVNLTNIADGATITVVGGKLVASGGGASYTAGDGVDIASGVISIKNDTTTGGTVAPLSLTGNGAGIPIDNSTITLNANGQLQMAAINGGTF